jgi:MarR family transcriptional regulator, temperature-dependent positive regulator of motility
MIDRAGSGVKVRPVFGAPSMARGVSDLTEGEPFRLAHSPSHLLHRAEQLAADRFTQLVGGDGVTLRQFAVLAAISENPGLSQSDLVRATGIDRSTLADMMNRMEKRGWVVRTASVLDARALSVRLAGAGSMILAAATQYARAADAAILDALPRAKKRPFIATLTKLVKAIDAAAVRAEREIKREAKRAARAQQKRRKNKKRERAQQNG